MMKSESELRAYQPVPVDAKDIRHVHFIGIAGTAMGTLAGMLKKMGYEVTGSDKGIYPPMSDQLSEWAIPVQQGFDPSHLDLRPDLVVVGNACRPSNQEVQAAVSLGLNCTSLPRAVHDLFLRNRKSVVVSGTHGKTTTTALTGWLLEASGLEPGVLIGGICPNFGGSFRLPKQELFVIEGDEYDSAMFDKVPKFLHYAPYYVALTSVEFDHADIYDDIDQVKQAFLMLMEKLHPEGHLWVCADYPLALEISSLAPCKVTPYGFGADASLIAKNIQWEEGGVRFDLFKDNLKVANFLSPMFGEYNIANALVAIDMAIAAGASIESIQKALPAFEGIRRRQEIIARIGDIVVIDDFAHHPTAIRVTTEAVKKRFSKRRIWGIFEPRSNTARRNFFQDIFPLSFDACDLVLFGWPYQYERMEEEERLDIAQVVQSLQERGKTAIAFPETDEIVNYITAKARPSDVFLIMSNGGFGGLHQRIVDALRNRFQEI